MQVMVPMLQDDEFETLDKEWNAFQRKQGGFMPTYHRDHKYEVP